MRATRIHLAALLALLLGAGAQAQTFGERDEAFVFFPTWHGIFTAELLRGWGFVIDIQKGVMFVAIFGYSQQGDDAFLTLQSAPVDPANPFVFTGDVFLTDQNADRTRDVGDFTMEVANGGGQPAWVLDIDSPYLTGTEIVLRRFGYLDADELSIFAGKRWLFEVAGILVEGQDESSVDLKFTDERGAYSDGTPFVAGFTDIAGDLANVFRDDEIGFYVVLFEPADLPGVQFVLELIASHTDAFGQVLARAGDETSQTVRAQGFVLTEDSVSSKVQERDPAAVQARSEALYQRWLASGDRAALLEGPRRVEARR